MPGLLVAMFKAQWLTISRVNRAAPLRHVVNHRDNVVNVVGRLFASFNTANRVLISEPCPKLTPLGGIVPIPSFCHTA